MSRFRSTVVWVSLSMSLSACGGGDSTPASIQMGGSVQGRLLILSPAVSTLAGSSTNGTADGTGTAARFSNPQGITTDGTNLYVADGTNFTIRRVGISFGNVSTLAGSAGSSGSSDGTGGGARFSSLYGITTDGANLYVADAGNNTVRKVVIATGAVTTLAGSAVNPPNSTDGTGAAARFNFPQGVTTDGANVFVADAGNNTIRKIAIGTGVVTTLAGSAADPPGSADGTGIAARFNNPVGITTDGANLYVTDAGNNTIRKIVIGTGAVTTLAGSPGIPGAVDGTGAFARFTGPSAITSDGTYLYVTDDGSTVRKVTINAGIVKTDVIGPNGVPITTTVAVAAGTVSTLAGRPGFYGAIDGTGDFISLETGVSLLTFGDARFWFPQGITTDGRNLYVSDSVNNMVRKVY